MKNEFIKKITVRNCELDSFEGKTLKERVKNYCVERFGKSGLIISDIDIVELDKEVYIEVTIKSVNENDHFENVYLEKDACSFMHEGEVSYFSTIKSIEAQLGGQKNFMIIDQLEEDSCYVLLVKVIGNDESDLKSKEITWLHVFPTYKDVPVENLMKEYKQLYKMKGLELVKYAYKEVDNNFEVLETIKPFDPRGTLFDVDCNDNVRINYEEKKFYSSIEIAEKLYGKSNYRKIEISEKKDGYRHELLIGF